MELEEQTIDKNSLIAIRDGAPKDREFIFATWLRGLRFGNDWFTLIDAKIYFSIYHRVIEALLASPHVSIKVACLKDDPDVILGYSVSRGTKLDWVFVKKAWRKVGIAKSLMPPIITYVTHVTKVGKSILQKYPKVSFNPFILEENKSNV